MSNFHFLFEEFSALGRAAQEAERQVYFSPTASCAMSRKALELTLRWMIEHDPDIEIPDDYSLYVLLTGGDLARLLQRDRCMELDLVRRLGNRGLHEGWLEEPQAKASIRYLHGFLTWLYESYAIRGECEPPLPAFREDIIPDFFPSKRKGSSWQGIFDEAADDVLIEDEQFPLEEQVSERGFLGRGDDFNSRKQITRSSWLEVMSSIIAFLLAILFSPLLIIGALIGSRRDPSRVNIQDEVGNRASFSSIVLESRSDVYEGTLNLTVPEPQIYSRRGIAGTSTPGVSLDYTSELFIEALLRESGWGSQLDRQIELRERCEVPWWDYPFISFVLLTEDLVPELVILNSTGTGGWGISELDMVKSGLDWIHSLMVDGDQDERWLSSILVFTIDGALLKRFNMEEGELVVVDGLSIRGSKGEG